MQFQPRYLLTSSACYIILWIRDMTNKATVYRLSMGFMKPKHVTKINNANVIKQLVHGKRASIKLWIHLGSC